ncbi:MAG: ArsR/SmtB family transcription factor [Candidatus Ranarchaeia archaeon]
MNTIDELDEIFSLLENPIRRKLIRRLSEAPNFALQLSKELRIAQQLVAKHLRVMEERGLISAIEQESPRGPKRKLYHLNRHISLRVDVAPNLYNQEIITFEKLPSMPDQKSTFAEIKKQIEAIAKTSSEKISWQEITNILSNIDDALERISLERTAFLYLRNRLLRFACNAMNNFSPLERAALIKILTNPKIKDSELSRQLNVPLGVIKQTLRKLKGSLL